MMTWIRIGAAFVLSGMAGSSLAAVVSSGADGFVVREEVVFSGTPAVAWQRLIRPQDWWNKDHTYSKDSRNLSLSLQPGGCDRAVRGRRLFTGWLRADCAGRR